MFSGHVETKILKFSPAIATKVRLPGRGRKGRERGGERKRREGEEGRGEGTGCLYLGPPHFKMCCYGPVYGIIFYVFVSAVCAFHCEYISIAFLLWSSYSIKRKFLAEFLDEKRIDTLDIVLNELYNFVLAANHNSYVDGMCDTLQSYGTVLSLLLLPGDFVSVIESLYFDMSLYASHVLSRTSHISKYPYDLNAFWPSSMPHISHPMWLTKFLSRIIVKEYPTIEIKLPLPTWFVFSVFFVCLLTERKTM